MLGFRAVRETAEEFSVVNFDRSVIILTSSQPVSNRLSPNTSDLPLRVRGVPGGRLPLLADTINTISKCN
ncbi:hypothetical protein BJX76DRAFT_343983, partial [Aspergillus varians]